MHSSPSRITTSAVGRSNYFAYPVNEIIQHVRFLRSSPENASNLRLVGDTVILTITGPNKCASLESVCSERQSPPPKVETERIRANGADLSPMGISLVDFEPTKRRTR